MALVILPDRFDMSGGQQHDWTICVRSLFPTCDGICMFFLCLRGRFIEDAKCTFLNMLIMTIAQS